MPKNKRCEEMISVNGKQPGDSQRDANHSECFHVNGQEEETIRKARQSRYERSSDGISIEGDSVVDKILKLIDVLGYWLFKLAPFVILLIAISKITPAALPLLFGSSGWNWLKQKFNR